VRHDRAHLQLVARCWLPYLTNVHDRALATPAAQDAAARIFSRAFTVLQHRPTAATLAEEGIDRAALMPSSAADSSIEKIRNAFRWQLPRLLGSD